MTKQKSITPTKSATQDRPQSHNEQEGFDCYFLESQQPVDNPDYILVPLEDIGYSDQNIRSSHEFDTQRNQNHLLCYGLQNDDKKSWYEEYKQAERTRKTKLQNQPKQSKRIEQKKKEKTKIKNERVAQQQDQTRGSNFIEMDDRSFSQFQENYREFEQQQQYQSYYSNLVNRQKALQEQAKNEKMEKKKQKNKNKKEEINNSTENIKAEKKKEGEKKEGEKKIKLLQRIFNYDYYYDSFNHITKLWDHYERKINVFDLDQIQTVQQYSDRKNELVKILQKREYKTSKNEDGHRIVQAAMLIDKYVIQTKNINLNGLKDLDWIIMITQDIRNALNQPETSKALEQIYLILNDQEETDKNICWEKVIKELKYQLEVNKNYFKSHCCGYYQYAKNFENKESSNENFEKTWYELRSEYKDNQQCKGGKKKFQKVDLSKLRDFTINDYLNNVVDNGYLNKYKNPEIYIDDLFNLIAKYEEF